MNRYRKYCIRKSRCFFLTLFLLIFFLTPFVSAEINSPDKISPALQSRLTDYPAWPVIILGKTQLFDGRNGFEQFCRKNADRKRSELRQEVMAQLRKIAEKEQKEILQAVGHPQNPVKLWLVNAIGVTLTRDQIQKVAELPSVQYIYADRATPVTVRNGGDVAQVFQTPKQKAPFSPDGKQVPWYLERIEADRAWKSLNVRGNHVVVALFDNGSEYRHPDLQNSLWINADEVPGNGKDDDDNGLPDDYYGYNFSAGTPGVIARKNQHGTWTAGLIAGDGASGIVTGVAPEAALMHLIAWGSYCHAAQAFEYALENGADVMNMSFSWPDLGQARGLIRRMSEHAVCAGLVQVSGAGNFGSGSADPAPVPVQLRIPEGIPSVIAAGGVDRNLKVPPFCSIGPVEWGQVRFYQDYPLPQGLIKPDVCAFPGPGYPILGTDPESGRHGYVNPNPTVGGNSFSGAMMSGVAALVLSAAPELPAWRVKEILEETATPIGGKEKNPRTGAGLVNAYRAVEAARGE